MLPRILILKERQIPKSSVVLQFEVLAREMGELRVFVPTQQESKHLGQYRTGYGPGERNSILGVVASRPALKPTGKYVFMTAT